MKAINGENRESGICISIGSGRRGVITSWHSAAKKMKRKRKEK
jgi:hypothetical protein